MQSVLLLNPSLVAVSVLLWLASLRLPPPWRDTFTHSAWIGLGIATALYVSTAVWLLWRHATTPSSNKLSRAVDTFMTARALAINFCSAAVCSAAASWISQTVWLMS